MIVYTANYGGKDHPIPTNQLCNDLEGIKFVYFTDKHYDDYGRPSNPTPSNGGWEEVVEKGRYEDPKMSAKWYKLHSHELFPDEPSVWIDAHYSLRVRPEREFTALTAEKPLVLFRHYYIDLAREYGVVRRRHKDEFMRERLLAQKTQYISEGFSMDTPVYRGTVLFRHPSVGEFNELWWDEVVKYEHRRDQISLPYIVWKTGIEFTQFDDANDRFFKVNHHLPRGRVVNCPEVSSRT